METKEINTECGYINCNETYKPSSRRERKYCCRACKNKASKLRRYNNDEDYADSIRSKSLESYHINKAPKYKPLNQLTEEDLERLKELNPKLFGNIQKEDE